MKRYENINDLDARIERIIKRKVKHYYTDWKNYDRPKYMDLKGSQRRDDKKIILIARECGTYLYTLEEIKNYSFAATVYEYYYTQEPGDYYFINLERLSIEKINPETYIKDLKKAA